MLKLRRMCGGGWRGARWRNVRRGNDAVIHDRSGWALAWGPGWPRRETNAAVVRRWARGDFNLRSVDRAAELWWSLRTRVACRLGRHEPIRIVDGIDDLALDFTSGADMVLSGRITAMHRECRRCGTELACAS